MEELIKLWKERQIYYENLAEINTNEHNKKNFIYAAMSTRDCWKELSKQLQNEK